jgi:4-hydroxy-tetrahydrodipicolinate synthase
VLTLRGVVPALTTPFAADHSLDLGAFKQLVDAVIDDGVDGLLVNGCTGESWAIEDDERDRLFRTAVEQTAGRVPVIVGCGAMVARQAIAKVRQAERAGCNAVMIQPPSYVMPSEGEVLDYYLQISRATALPVVLYNIPRRTGIHLSLAIVERLAEEPNVIALKESSKDFLVLAEMIRHVGDRIAVFAGYAALLGLAAITEGAAGYMDSATPVLGRLSVEFYEAARTGNLPRARDLQARMARLNRAFFGLGTFPAAVKAGLDLMGRPGGPTRDPIKPLDEAGRTELRRVLQEVGLLPTPVPA